MWLGDTLYSQLKSLLCQYREKEPWRVKLSTFTQVSCSSTILRFFEMLCLSISVFFLYLHSTTYNIYPKLCNLYICINNFGYNKVLCKLISQQSDRRKILNIRSDNRQLIRRVRVRIRVNIYCFTFTFDSHAHLFIRILGLLCFYQWERKVGDREREWHAAKGHKLGLNLSYRWGLNLLYTGHIKLLLIVKHI